MISVKVKLFFACFSLIPFVVLTILEGVSFLLDLDRHFSSDKKRVKEDRRQQKEKKND